MNIGDKVRLIHSKGEGIITRILKNDLFEVEIEDGFRLPILKRELAFVSKNESNFFANKNSDQSLKPNPILPKAEKGIFLGFEKITDKELSIYLINNTDWELPIILSTGSDKNHKGILAGILHVRSFLKSEHKILLKDLDEYETFVCQILFFTHGYFKEKQPFIKKLRIKNTELPFKKKFAPLVERELYIFQLDTEDEKPFTVNADELKEKILENKSIEESRQKQFQVPSSVVDLHIEKLSQNHLSMNNAQMLDLQLKTFEKNLESAIASGLDEVTFIHGVGNGVLKNEIQKQLSKHKNVAYYEDAQKEKFGYGATKVRIK